MDTLPTVGAMRMRRSWYIAIGLFLFCLLGYRIAESPVTGVVDPDGYVSYAEHLLDHHSLPVHRRLPGYPAFVAFSYRVASIFGDVSINEAVHHVQGVIVFLSLVAIHLLLVRSVGRLTGLAFLLVMAVPNYFVWASTEVYPDVLSAITVLLIGALICLIVQGEGVRRQWLPLCMVTVSLFAAIQLRQSNYLLVTIFLMALTAVALLRPDRVDLLRRWFPKILIVLAINTATATLVTTFFDRGARDYAAIALPGRVVAVLGPAYDTPEERRVDRAKIEFQERYGERVEDVSQWERLYRGENLSVDTFAWHPDKDRVWDTLIRDGYITRIGLVRSRFPYDVQRFVLSDDALDSASIHAFIMKSHNYGFIAFEDAQRVWKGRLLHHPVAFMRSMFFEVLWRYHKTLKEIAPFWSGHRQYFYVFPARGGGVAARLFRATGIDLERLGRAEKAPITPGRLGMIATFSLAEELLKVLFILLPFAIGIASFWRKWPIAVAAGLLCFGGFVVFLSAFGFVFVRYLMPFILLFYVLWAHGAVLLVGKVGKRVFGWTLEEAPDRSPVLSTGVNTMS
jgi:hypothetical protein